MPSLTPQADGPAYLGQVADTYLVLVMEDGGLGLLDQHAAHERILFHRYERDSARGASRPLALALDIALHPAEAARLDEMWGDLFRLGFALERPRPDLLVVRAVPPDLDAAKAREFLRDTLSGKRGDLRELWCMLACRAALKAGEPLSAPEACTLMAEWAKVPDREHCPHGRPVLVRLGRRELEKLFKR